MKKETRQKAMLVLAIFMVIVMIITIIPSIF